MRSTSVNGRRERKPTRMPRSSASGESSVCHSPSSAEAQLVEGLARRRPPGRRARRGRSRRSWPRASPAWPRRSPGRAARTRCPGGTGSRGSRSRSSASRRARLAAAGARRRAATPDLHRRGSRSGAGRRARRPRGGCRGPSSPSARARPHRARAARAPLAVELARAGRAEQLDLQAIERDGDRRARSVTCPTSQSASSSAQAAGRTSASPRRSAISRDAGDLVARRPVQRGLEDVGLGREVPGGRGQRDAGLGRDAAVGDGGDALARDDLHGRGDDRLADPLEASARVPGTAHRRS